MAILERWSLPTELTEISGIARYKNKLIAIQDEDGELFVFDPATGKVERRIPFAGAGDYEGIAVVGETAWVLRADGRLFEVSQFWGKTPLTREYPTPLGKKNDTEGLCYDAKNNRLLIALKGKSFDKEVGKGVYAFDLNTQSFKAQPVYRLVAPASGTTGSKKKHAKKNQELRPSEIAIHPVSGHLFILDGPAFHLYETNTDGAIIGSFPLPKTELPQAEGLAFAPDGFLYISSEGRKGNGTILKVRLNSGN